MGCKLCDLGSGCFHPNQAAFQSARTNSLRETVTEDEKKNGESRRAEKLVFARPKVLLCEIDDVTDPFIWTWLSRRIKFRGLTKTFCPNDAASGDLRRTT